MSNKGTLFLCATPIGNLEDITLRVLRTLKEVDLIAAEDTRHTRKLLTYFDIHKPLVSYHEHNKTEKGQYIVNQLQEGKNIALVSDAGTPAISDPGEDLVKLCIQNGIDVSALPGAAAAITGLIMSGLSTTRFSFEGFLSTVKRHRREHMEQLKNDMRTLIFYEAPHKLAGTLKDLLQVLGNRRIAVARELTKKFEEVVRCTLEEAVKKYDEEQPKGEFVLVVEGADPEQLEMQQQEKWKRFSLQQHIDMYMEQGIDHKKALKRVAKDRGVSKREIYALQLKEKKGQ